MRFDQLLPKQILMKNVGTVNLWITETHFIKNNLIKSYKLSRNVETYKLFLKQYQCRASSLGRSTRWCQRNRRLVMDFSSSKIFSIELYQLCNNIRSTVMSNVIFAQFCITPSDYISIERLTGLSAYLFIHICIPNYLSVRLSV